MKGTPLEMSQDNQGSAKEVYKAQGDAISLIIPDFQLGSVTVSLMRSMKSKSNLF